MAHEQKAPYRHQLLFGRSSQPVNGLTLNSSTTGRKNAESLELSAPRELGGKVREDQGRKPSARATQI